MNAIMSALQSQRLAAFRLQRMAATVYATAANQMDTVFTATCDTTASPVTCGSKSNGYDVYRDLPYHCIA